MASRKGLMLLTLLAVTLTAASPRAQPCETANMMIVLDKSGSMWDDRKWVEATEVLDYLVNNYSGIVRFGLTLFPGEESTCAPGGVVVDLGSTPDEIMNTINANNPGGGTPLATTLLGLNSYRPLKDLNRRNFVMLVTDGVDYCAANTNDAAASAADLYQNGIRTFVIGFGSAVDASVLEAIAIAGHTGHYQQAYYQEELQQAMDQIIAEILTEACDGLDNDCDGLTDETWAELGQMCSHQQGLCTFQGVYACNKDRDGVFCDAEIATTPEVCDGFDNDCNGLIDDGFPDQDSDGYTSCTDCCDSGAEGLTGCDSSTRAGINPGATEVCNGYDDDCNGSVDESDPQLGATCGVSDVGECRTGSMLCIDGVLTCAGAVAPCAEICDNRDNDCDGQTDEVVRRVCQTACGNALQICTAGQWSECTAPRPSPELCDGLDNDCDGRTDEDFLPLGSACSLGRGECLVQGVYLCSADGTHVVCGAEPPAGTEEICDGKDNDCDGATDESDPRLGSPCGECTAGEQPPCYTNLGECQPGTLLCQNGELTCAGEVNPVPEICDVRDHDCDGQNNNGFPNVEDKCDDGIDNDCDGLTDGWDDDCGSACQPGQQMPCGTSTGDCELGVRVCDAGQWGPCEGGWGPTTEVCDGRDNDCDGETDENATPEICDDGLDNDCDGLVDEMDPDCGECTPGETRDCGTGQGECRTGVQTCTVGSRWSECAGDIGPEPESCDGLDNDCDGATDEGDLCDGYDACLCAECAPPCSAGECPAGSLVCVHGWCVSDPCCGLTCPPGRACDQNGRCVDPCVTGDVSCDPTEDCRMGICVPADCFTEGHECPQGQRCSAGTCEDDPCHLVECPPDRFCKEGSCLPVGCDPCTPDQICQEGRCLDSPCAGLRCENAQICLNGECAADPCQGVYCPQATICLNGTCTDDPCQNIDCPPASLCREGYCVAGEEQPEDGGTDAGADDGADAGQDAGQDAGPGDDPGAPDTGSDPQPAVDGFGKIGGGCGCSVSSPGSSQGANSPDTRAILVLWILLALFLRRHRELPS